MWFFRAVWCFFGEAILSYSETESAAMCGKTNFLGTLGSITFCLLKQLPTGTPHQRFQHLWVERPDLPLMGDG